MAVSGNVLQSDALARLGKDSFLPNIQQVSLDLESLRALSTDLSQKIPSVEELSDLMAETLSWAAVTSDIQADGLEQTKEVDDHEKIIKPGGSHLNTEETDKTKLKESSTNTAEREQVDSVDSLNV